MKKIIGFLAFLSLVSAIHADIVVGSKVAVFLEEAWRLAEVTAMAGGKVTLKAPFGLTPTVAVQDVIEIPARPKLAVDQVVYAYMESDGSFQVGTVREPGTNKVLIAWQDGSATVEVPMGLIITDTVRIAGKDLNAADEDTRITVMYRGSDVGNVDADGWVWLHGRTVGRIGGDNTVYVDGTAIGRVRSEGMAEDKDGRTIGTLDGNGTVTVRGNIAGSIDAEGTVRVDGTVVGGAKGLRREAVAIIFFFFFDAMR